MQAAGASLLVVSPQREHFSEGMRRKSKLDFDMLYDRGNQVATQFGLTFALPEDLRDVYRKLGADLPRFNGDDSWTLPMPGRFIVDSSSAIRYAAADPDYTVRPEPDETVRALRELATLRLGA